MNIFLVLQIWMKSKHVGDAWQAIVSKNSLNYEIGHSCCLPGLTRLSITPSSYTGPGPSLLPCPGIDQGLLLLSHLKVMNVVTAHQYY